jgi:hypothetical protein
VTYDEKWQELFPNHREVFFNVDERQANKKTYKNLY